MVPFRLSFIVQHPFINFSICTVITIYLSSLFVNTSALCVSFVYIRYIMAMRRRRIPPNDRGNRDGQDAVVQAIAPRRREVISVGWRFFVPPIFITLFFIVLFVNMKRHAAASQMVKPSSGGHRLDRPFPRTLTATIRHTQHDYSHASPSLPPTESIWPEERSPRATNEDASIKQIETLLTSYAFTMATRSYWNLEVIMSLDVVWNVIDHRKSSTPRTIQGRKQVRTELETLYRPYITGHRQNITRIELLQFDRVLAVTEFEISLVESSRPEDGYKGRSSVGKYVDELIWTNATRWQIGTRVVEYTVRSKYLRG